MRGPQRTEPVASSRRLLAFVQLAPAIAAFVAAAITCSRQYGQLFMATGAGSDSSLMKNLANDHATNAMITNERTVLTNAP